MPAVRRATGCVGLLFCARRGQSAAAPWPSRQRHRTGGCFQTLNRRRQTAVKEPLRFPMGKGQLLTADFQKLIAHPQVGNAQLRKVTRQDNQRQVFRLMAQEETHGLVNNRVGDRG